MRYCGLIDSGPDIELQQAPTRVAGYADLARFITSDKVFCIFRRFDRTSVRCLLYLQDEISELEKQLDALDQADLQAGDEVALYSLHSRRHDQNQQRKELLRTLSEKLYTYRKLTEPATDKIALTRFKKRDCTCTQSVCRWRRLEICI